MWVSSRVTGWQSKDFGAAHEQYRILGCGLDRFGCKALRRRRGDGCRPTNILTKLLDMV